jgi:spoIIIJ-associated protein
VEWVETTGKTVEEAKDAALDQLGVDDQDAEFEVLEEPRAGLFGRLRGEARVRARVRPTQPRPKAERRDRRGRPGKDGRGGDRKRRNDRKPSAPKEAPATTAEPDAAVAVLEAADTAPAEATAPAEPAANGADGAAGGERSTGTRRRSRGGRGGGGNRGSRGPTEQDDDQEDIQMTDAQLTEQGEVVREFLVDLLDAFGLDGQVTATPADESAVELAVEGADLGLLIGPKAATLEAVQELSRSVLQRSRPGESHARIRVDVGGYRAQRREALARFVTKLAEEVRDSGVQKALEPMSPPDRKVVHDTVNEIDGVRTMSEGEDTRRRVVILPE